MTSHSFRTSTFFILFISISALTFSSSFLRYNHAGYYPNEKKRVIICSDNSLQNEEWILSKKGVTILSGKLTDPVKKSDYTAQNYNYEAIFSSVTSIGEFIFSVSNSSINQTIHIKNNPYEGVKFEILKTIRARRSGSKDAIIHSISHLGDSSCQLLRNNGLGNNKSDYIQDINNQKINAVGGWYDAGDYIKFTLTNAYTTYQILRTYNLNSNIDKTIKIYSTTSYNDLLDEAVFGLSYLEKMFPDTNTFIIQVADETDHQQGFRLPENDNLDGSRKAYAAFSKPQMAMTVAALALGARTLKEYGNIYYSNQLQRKAMLLYQTILSKGVKSTWYEKAHEIFYKDETANDNMKLAAIELYNLTKEPKYLSEVNSYNVGPSYWSSWADVSMIANNTSIEHNPNQAIKVKSSLDYFKTIANKTDNIWNMPHNSAWGTLYSYFSVANAALNYQIVTHQQSYKEIALDVLDYTMGLNNWGKAFIISEIVPNTIENPYAQLYRLQPNILAIGEIAEGPAPKSTHDQNNQYFSPPHNQNHPDNLFNTNNLTFFDYEGDYVCMETIITGLSDGLFLLAQAEELFTTTSPLQIGDNISVNENQEFIIYPNPTSERLTIDSKKLSFDRCSFFDMNGNHLISIRAHGNESTRSINISSWKAGVYTTIFFLKNGKTKIMNFEKL